MKMPQTISGTSAATHNPREPQSSGLTKLNISLRSKHNNIVCFSDLSNTNTWRATNATKKTPMPKTVISRLDVVLAPKQALDRHQLDSGLVKVRLDTDLEKNGTQRTEEDSKRQSLKN